MTVFIKIPITETIEATQWFKNGDHPKDGNKVFTEGEFKGQPKEGKIVRYYKSPYVNAEKKCKHCHHIMNNHGWIGILRTNYTVCPGDFIITDDKGEHYPCKPDIFKKMYIVPKESNKNVNNNVIHFKTKQH